MFCGKCGSKLLDGYEFCMKCGTKIDLLISEDNENDVNISFLKSKKKILIPIITIVSLIIMIGIVFYFMQYAKERSGLYNNIAWGTSKEKIKEMLGDNIIGGEEGDNDFLTIISDYDGMKDVEGLVSYYFVDNGLHEINLTLINNENSSYTDSMIIEKYANKFDNLYGNKKEDIGSYIWNTKESKIELFYVTDKFVVINYKDITKAEEY